MWWWYFSLNIFFSVWVWEESKARSQDFDSWGGFMPLAGVFFFPLYLAKRPLVGIERREGGPVWVFAKVFALTWTMFMLGWVVLQRGLPALMLVGRVFLQDGFRELYHADLRMNLPGLSTVVVVWALVMVPVLVLLAVYWQRRSWDWEDGPGRLAGYAPEELSRYKSHRAFTVAHRNSPFRRTGP